MAEAKFLAFADEERKKVILILTADDELTWLEADEALALKIMKTIEREYNKIKTTPLESMKKKFNESLDKIRDAPEPPVRPGNYVEGDNV